MRTIHYVIVFLGFLLMYLTYTSRYGYDIFDIFIWVGLIFISLIIFAVNFYRDTARFLKHKKLKNFATSFLILTFAGAVYCVELKNQYDKGKPSLVKVSYHGDINGADIDFKTDGTFIFDNYAILGGRTLYGVYILKGNQITLDRKHLENVIVSKLLEIKTKEIYNGTIEKYLYQTDNEGKILTNEIEFKVIEDNRN